MASQEICQNTTLEALEVVVSGNTNTGDFSYQWFSNTTNANYWGNCYYRVLLQMFIILTIQPWGHSSIM